MARVDSGEALRGWLDYVADANRRTAGLARAMAVAAETDPVAAGAVADLDARRRRDIGIAAAWAAERGMLPAADVEQATDELNHLVGPETYAFFVARSNWTFERYRAWLDAALGSLLARWGAGEAIVG